MDGDLAGFTSRLKAEAHGCGVDLIGFSRMDGDEMYLRPENRDYLKNLGYRYAISIAARISLSACELLLKTGDAGLLYYFDVHCRERAAVLDRAAHRICLYLEDAGRRAFSVPGLGVGYRDGGARVIVSHITQARLAGLGEMGDSGMLITPEYGPRVRLATILTDQPLPLVSEKARPVGICTHCGLCKKICPSGCINGGRFDPRHPEKYYTDKPLCTAHRDAQKEELGSRFCNLCMAVCPVGASFRVNAGNGCALRG